MFTHMQNTQHLEHPTEEALERFILQRSREEELENVEEHILACQPCIDRIEVAATKLALQQLQSERAQREFARQQGNQKNWFRTPAFSMAGAIAAIAIGVYVVPQFTHGQAGTIEATFSAYRGSESTSLPAGHPLHLHLNATDLAEGPVAVEVVSDRGAGLWKGTSSIRNASADVTLPAMSGTGSRFLRLYRGSADGELLREFAFQIK